MADNRITGFNPATTLTNDAVLPVVVAPTGSAETQKITVDNLSTALMKETVVITNDLQLTGSTDDGFANTTGLEIWNFANSASGNEVGLFGHTLTLAGANAATASNDVLGVSRYNTAGAETYWTSTSTDFNIANTADTDDFMYGGWFYLPDVTSNQIIIGNTTDAAAHGYILQVATGLLYNYLLGATDKNTATTITTGWHHIVSVREVGVGLYTFMDGILIGSTGDTTIGTTQTKFQIGGYNHGATYKLVTGVILDEIFFKKGVLPTNYVDVIRNIYARSAKKFAVKDANTNVYSLDDNLLKLSSGVYYPILTNTTNIAASTAYPLSWSRVGNVVTVMIQVDIDPTAAAPTSTKLTMTLPVASTTTPIGGGSVACNSYTQTGLISCQSATSAEISYMAVNVANASFRGILQYVVN